jgi:hypothetical protein
MELITLAIAVTAVVLAAWTLVIVNRDRRRYDDLPRDSADLLESIRTFDEDLAAAEAVVAKIVPTVQSLEERMPGALRYAAVVTFDAQDDRTGLLSKSIALMNERKDGLVITLLHGPRQTLFFTKMLRNGNGIEPLSVEEQAAVDRAVGG